MDWNAIEGMWKETKTKIQAKWSKLTDEDLDLIGGRRDRLEIKIHQRYGFAPSHVSKEIDDWVRWQAPTVSPPRSAILSFITEAAFSNQTPSPFRMWPCMHARGK